MAVISTQELFKRFFENKDPETVRKTRSQVDRPEVYAYEEKIGKQLVDMNEDELFEMICSFNNKKSSVRDGIKIGSGTFKKYISNFRLIFQYYIDNVAIIRNPFNSEKFKGIQADALLADNKDRFTYKQLEKVIETLHSSYDREHADYYELVIRLFYDGFAEAQEIADLKEDQINFRKMEVRLPGRTISKTHSCPSGRSIIVVGMSMIFSLILFALKYSNSLLISLLFRLRRSSDLTTSVSPSRSIPCFSA